MPAQQPAPAQPLAERQEAWTRYWRSGPLHCLPGSFAGNYDGGIGAFWAGVSADLRTGQRVLDIGTGNGALPAMLAELQPELEVRVDAVDLAQPAPAWLDGAPAPVRQRIRFHGGVGAESLPFDDAVFDLALSQYGIEYTRHEASLAELARVLRQGGRCAFVIHHSRSRLCEVARDEVASAGLLLEEGGLLQRADGLLPFLARAATGQAQQLRADPEATRAREAFNAAAQAAGRAAASMRHPELLGDAQQWVSGMASAVLQGQVTGR